jgi:hypothetical protein
MAVISVNFLPILMPIIKYIYHMLNRICIDISADLSADLESLNLVITYSEKQGSALGLARAQAESRAAADFKSGLGMSSAG